MEPAARRGHDMWRNGQLFFEGFNLHRWRIVIFGAGHVAQALTRCLLNLECQIVCIDRNPSGRSQLPESPRLTVLQVDDLPQAVDQLTDEDFVVCMTMGHRTDGPILQRIFHQKAQRRLPGCDWQPGQAKGARARATRSGR